jgi:hypothetical protein
MNCYQSIIEWQRAKEHYVYSHCGKYVISPIYGGLTRPESYIVSYENKRIGSGQTQRECKDVADEHAFVLILESAKHLR